MQNSLEQKRLFKTAYSTNKLLVKSQEILTVQSATKLEDMKIQHTIIMNMNEREQDQIWLPRFF